MYKVLLFAGTIEGRMMAEFLDRQGVKTYACVATEYGKELLPKSEFITVSDKRLTMDEMAELCRETGAELVIDATHPYAEEVTENITGACEKAGTEYIRLIRGGGTEGPCQNGFVYVDSVDEAVDYLAGTEGRILVTTGSKEIAKYTAIENYRERVIARVLSLSNVSRDCAELGFEGKNLICMQGPFSKEMNLAMLRQYGCRYLVTKMSGPAGGFDEKIEACIEAGAVPVIVGRPAVETGLSMNECKKAVCEKLGCKAKQQISLVGIGTGSRENMTEAAIKACEEAELLIGAKRMTDAVAKEGQVCHMEYNSVKIREHIEAHPEFEKIAVVLSGDVGFYSGAKKLLDELEGFDVDVICGISSLVYFASRIRRSWDDVYLTSAHGRKANLIDAIRTHRKVFSILGTSNKVCEICNKLVSYGMGDCRVFVGEQLSYENEEVIEGRAVNFTEYEGDPLSVIYIENDNARLTPATHGLRDSEFLRAKVPMTKEEVRAVSLAKMGLMADSVCWDVGAGTGSVSIEMALRVTEGDVYAIERKPEAVELINKNKEKFAIDNLHIVEGLAPEALHELPAPTHVFIGGSAGNMKEILEYVLERNPEAVIVINCIAVETVAETMKCLRELPLTDTDIVSMQVARAKAIGSYHLMMGENPITIISARGKGETR